MSYIPTGGWNVTLAPQYVEETTYGVTPANAAFASCGPLVDITHNNEVGYLDYRQIGSRDLYSQIQTGIEYSFDITFNPIDEVMIKYGIALPGGPGTIEKSITILMQQKINNVDTYIIYKGCRCDSTDIEITNDGAVEVSQTWFAKERVISTTHGLTGTPDFVTAGEFPTDEPWTNLDGTTTTASPLDWGATNVDVSSFSVSVTNNLERIKPNGQLTNKFVEPTLRDIEFEFATWLKDTNTLMADATSATARDVTYVLKAGSGGFELNLTQCRINSETSSDATSATEHKMLEIAGKSETISIDEIL
jgi:hypothetical protein